jgi:hypothetical protein
MDSLHGNIMVTRRTSTEQIHDWLLTARGRLHHYSHPFCPWSHFTLHFQTQQPIAYNKFTSFHHEEQGRRNVAPHSYQQGATETNHLILFDAISIRKVSKRDTNLILRLIINSKPLATPHVCATLFKKIKAF